MSFLLSPTLELLRNCHAAVQRGLQFRPILGGGFHSVLLPKDNYSPWMGDRDFRAAYAAVEKSTLVDVYRCYELWQLVAETAKAGAGDLLEVGVWRGGTGALIAMRSRTDGTGGTVCLCDTFSGVPKTSAAGFISITSTAMGS